jgi:hypothetical protein
MMEDIGQDCFTDLPPVVLGRQIIRRRNAHQQQRAAGRELVLCLPAVDILIPCAVPVEPAAADLEFLDEIFRSTDGGSGGPLSWCFCCLPPVDASGKDQGQTEVLATGAGAASFAAALPGLRKTITEMNCSGISKADDTHPF